MWSIGLLGTFVCLLLLLFQQPSVMAQNNVQPIQPNKTRPVRVSIGHWLESVTRDIYIYAFNWN